MGAGVDISNLAFFVLINKFLRDQIDEFQSQLLSQTMALVAFTALALLTLWLVIQGWRILFGRSQQLMMDLVGDALKAVIVLSVAAGMAAGSSPLYKALTDGLIVAIASLVDGANDPYQRIDENLAVMQAMFSTIDAISSGNDPTLASAKVTAKWFSAIGVAGPAVIGGALLLINKVAIALFVGLGPLFIACLLFGPTKSLFSRWLLYGIGSIFSLAVLSFMVVLATRMVGAIAVAFLAKYGVLKAFGTAEAVEGISSLALQQGGVGLVLTTMLVSIPPMAANFFQGTLGSYLTYSAFGSVGAERPGAAQAWAQRDTRSLGLGGGPYEQTHHASKPRSIRDQIKTQPTVANR